MSGTRVNDETAAIKIHDDERANAAEGFGCCGYILIGISYLVFIFTLPLSLLFSIRIVREYERAVIMRLGRIFDGGAKGPGLFFILPCIDDIVTVDLRTITFDVPPQEILTKDSVTVTVDAVCYYRTYNPVAAVTNITNAAYSTRLLAATTLRNILGTKSLQEILQDKDSIATKMQESLDEATDSWGIKVERTEVKDVRLPYNMQRAMATEAEADREAKAGLIAAQGEQKASIALKEAADVISQNPVSIQLRYLQTLSNISDEKNSTIIFPIPLEMLKKLGKNEN